MTSNNHLTSFRSARAGARVCYAALLIFATVLAGLFQLPLSPQMPRPGPAKAWAYAVNEAVSRHLVFGRDVIFAYGPLGSVGTWLYHPATDALILAASSLMAAGLCAGFAMLAWPKRTWLLLLLPIVVAESDAGLWASPLLLLLVVFRLSLAPDSRLHLPLTRTLALGILLLSGAVGLLPLVKGTYLILAVAEGSLAVLTAVIAGRLALAGGITSIAVISLCAGWVAAGQPLPALPNFFWTELPIIFGYSEAMSLHGPFREVLFWIIATGAMTAILYACVARRGGPAGWLLLLGVGLYSFLIFKEGFVREDGHQLISAEAFLFLGLLLTALLNPRPALAVAILACLGWLSIELSERPASRFGAGTFLARLENHARRVVNGPPLRLAHPRALSERFAEANAAIAALSPLPRIKGTVDLYPDYLSLLFAQKMRWDGRPVIQSYSAYTPALEQANAAHLLGNRAPRNIFFTIDPIDGRLAALEDGASWPLLLSRYSIVGMSGNYLRMVRAPSPSPPRFGPRFERISARTNEWLDVPSRDGLLWAKIDMRPTLLGKLVLTAFRLPRVTIELRLAGGRVVRRRYIPEMGRAGFLLSPYVGSTSRFAMIAAGLTRGHRVRQFRLDAPDFGLWAANIPLSLRVLSVLPQPNVRRLVLTEPTSPPAFVAAAKRGAVADCALDTIDRRLFRSLKQPIVVSGRVDLQGWTAPSARQGIGPDATWIALTAADGERKFYRAKATRRPDVLAAFKQPTMKDPGFSANLDLSGLSGNQKLTVYSVHGSKAFRCRQRALLAIHR